MQIELGQEFVGRQDRQLAGGIIGFIARDDRADASFRLSCEMLNRILEVRELRVYSWTPCFFSNSLVKVARSSKSGGSFTAPRKASVTGVLPARVSCQLRAITLSWPTTTSGSVV